MLNSDENFNLCAVHDLVKVKCVVLFAIFQVLLSQFSLFGICITGFSEYGAFMLLHMLPCK